MLIQKIQFKNYKRFHDFTIDLGGDPRRIVALIGPNGCGKSSVLDGIVYVNKMHRYVGNSNRDRDYHYNRDLESDELNNVVTITLKNKSFIDVIEKMHRSKSTFVSFRSPYRYNQNVDIKKIEAIEDIALNNYGAGSASDLDAKMNSNYVRLQISYDKYLNDNDVKPSEAKEHVIGELNKSLQNCLNLSIDNLGNVQDGKGTLYFSKPDHTDPFSFNVLSSGEKEVVDILIDLYLRKNDFDDTIFLIDEPELHINTNIQRKLLKEIDNLIGEKCQIWITTHSLGFMRALQSDFKDNSQIITFPEDANFASEKITLKPKELNFQDWKEIYSTAIDDMTGLVCPEKIIYCEGLDKPSGKGEERGFDATIFNSIFSTEFPNTLFVSSGGNKELDQRREISIQILSKAITDLDIHILKDRDCDSGKIVTVEKRLEILNSSPKHFHLLTRWEIENYLFDQEILKLYCINKNTEFDEDAYNKIIPDITNEDVKSICEDILVLCGHHKGHNANSFKSDLANLITPETHVYNELKSCIFDQR